jgi:dephospho-CoA kinase
MSTDPEVRPRRPHSGDGLFVLGLVGRAGSGKSSAARALADDGAVVIDADRVGHEVTEQDPEVHAALALEYGPDVYGPDGRLDRARVAARVFADAEARERLDRIVHPRLVARLVGRLDELRARGFRGVVVLDAALLLEWGLERECDAVIAMTAPAEEQVRRLGRLRGWSAAEAARRLAAQRSDEAFRAAADLTLDNSGSPEGLEQEVRAAVARLQAAGQLRATRPGEDGPC